MVSFALVILLGAVPTQGPDPLARAQNFYQRARYEKALQALGADCAQLADVAACEKIRAFCHIALGDEGEARAAFDRLLVADIEADLGPEVSPKLQALFGDAKRAMLEIQELELEAPLSEDAPILLEARAPLSAPLDTLTAYVRGEDMNEFLRVPLDRMGEVYSGRAELEGTQFDYYFVARLASGIEIGVGSEQGPLRLGGGSGRRPVRDDLRKADEDDDGGGLFGGGEGEPLPRWAFWSMVGGGAAVVVIGLTVGIIMASGGGDGTINVNVTFDN